METGCCENFSLFVFIMLIALASRTTSNQPNFSQPTSPPGSLKGGRAGRCPYGIKGSHSFGHGCGWDWQPQRPTDLNSLATVNTTFLSLVRTSASHNDGAATAALFGQVLHSNSSHSQPNVDLSSVSSTITTTAPSLVPTTKTAPKVAPQVSELARTQTSPNLPSKSSLV